MSNKLNKVTSMFLILTRLEILKGESSAWHFNFKISTEDIKSMTGQKVQSAKGFFIYLFFFIYFFWRVRRIL